MYSHQLLSHSDFSARNDVSRQRSAFASGVVRVWSRAIILLLSLMPAMLSAASQYADIENLMKRGQWLQALQHTEQLRKNNAEDAQLRFLHARVLIETGEEAKARKIYQSLIEEFPDHPEPYNNLAASYAAKGDYQQARKILEQAMSGHAGFAEVYQNLTAVYGYMASRAYQQALDENEPLLSDRVRLGLVDHIDWPIAAVVPLDKVQGAVSAENTASSVRDDNPIMATVQRWAQAWSAQDVAAYLAFYDELFTPPKGISFTQWQKQRRLRLKGPSFIRIDVREPKLDWLSNDVASVNFIQNYESNRLNDSIRKQLILKWSGNQWRIIQENLLR